MSSVYSLHDMQKQREFFTLLEWKGLLGETLGAQVSVYTESMNVLRHQDIPIFPEAIWGFGKGNSEPRFYFFGGKPSFSAVSKQDRKPYFKWKFYGAWIPYLSSVCQIEPDYKVVLKALSHAPQDAPVSDAAWKALIRPLSNLFIGEWQQFDDLIVYGVYKIPIGEDSKPFNVDDKDFMDDREEIATSYYDQHKLKQPINRNIPWAKIFENRKSSPSKTASIFLDPKAFKANLPVKSESFLWPWQKCITVSSKEKNTLEYKPIKTVSLACDLRFSTAAMQLFNTAKDYAVFIDRIVNESKEIVLECGGYFDKETGDGLIAHFCSQNGDKCLDMEENCDLIEDALRAAEEIRTKCKQICHEAQSEMGQGLGALQVSIGIHIDDAVWIADEGQIKAIGPSVVWAARLCNTAKPLEILISNASYQNFVKSKRMGSVLAFKRRYVEFKEYRPESKIFAYSDQIEDDIT